MIAARRRIFLFLVWAVLFPAAASAQQKSLESLLPGDTILYLSWQGEAGMSAHKAANSLLRLWNDPDLAPAHALMAGSLLSQDAKDLPPLTADEFKQLLSNPAMFAVVRLPAGVKPHEKDASKKGLGASGFHAAVLGVYDRAGREQVLDKVLNWAPQGKPAPTVTKSAFRGLQIEEVKSGTDTSYRALAGHFLVLSDYREIAEQWAANLASASPARGLLEESPEFRAARQRAGSGAAASFFFNMRVLLDSLNAEMKDEQGRRVIQSLHLDQIHSIVGSLSFDEPATRFQFSLLGNIDPGGLLGLIAPSRADFPTLKLTPAAVFSYSATRLDLSALYRFARTVFEAAVPPGQGLAFNQIDQYATQQFGMSIDEMLKLLSGDFTFIKQDPQGDLAEGIFILGVEKPADVLHVLELLFASNITNEESDGDVTYLSFALPQPAAPGKAAAQKKFYNLAIGPKMLVIAHRKSDARNYLARARATAGGESSLASDPKFLAARSRLPAELSSVSYVDLTRVEWKDMVDKFSAFQNPAPDPQKLETIKAMFPSAAFTRNLHSMVTGMWRDRSGIYYDGYIE
jgi:hypothetical protein